MKATIKSTKWYGRFWPPERKKIRIMQAMLEYMAKTEGFEEKVSKEVNDYLMYGIEPTYTNFEGKK